MVSEYTLLSKKRPLELRNVPVVLDEYMIFENGNEEHKTVVLRLKQQSTIDFDSIVIQIKQLDATNEIISVANYAFDDIVIKSHKKRFVPEKKIKLYNECVEIEYRLLKAESSDMLWENDTWNDKQTPAEPKEVVEETFVTQSINPGPIELPILVPLIILIVHVIILISVFYIAANIQ